MDDRVIEAAAMAILTEFGEVPYYRDMAESAIMAADAARAEVVKAAVDRLEAACIRHGEGQTYTAARNARRDLLTLLGIEDQP